MWFLNAARPARTRIRKSFFLYKGSAGNAYAVSRPGDIQKFWNFKGYMNNAWHRVTVQVGG